MGVGQIDKDCQGFVKDETLLGAVQVSHYAELECLAWDNGV